MEDLSAAGLSPTEAKCYKMLLQKKQWLPSDLAKSVQETRTNIYKILDKLSELKLAERLEDQKKLRYRAAHPSRLLELAREQRAQQQRAEQALELQAQELLQDYLQVHEQPGVRYFQGTEEIRQIFKEIARAKEEVVFINTPASIDAYGFENAHNLRMMAANAGVHRRALTADVPEAPIDYRLGDPKVLLRRTWFSADDYNAPVEWGAFDDKLYVISFGQEIMGMIIQNQPIADGFKQLFSMLERGQNLLPDYDTLPRNATKRVVSTPEI